MQHFIPPDNILYPSTKHFPPLTLLSPSPHSPSTIQDTDNILIKLHHAYPTILKTY